MKGIDVSKYQGVIDWAKVKAAGIEFSLIRAGIGRYTFQEDSLFRKNAEGCLANKIPFGVYWYSYATTTAEAEQEADVCLKVISRYKDKISLPVFFDQEYEKGILALTNAQRTNICIAFMKKIEAAGYRPGLYCSYDWWASKLDNTKLTAYPVWIAQYTSSCSYKGDNLVCWQYSSTGKVSGVTGNVDLDEGYDSLFNIKYGWTKRGDKWYYCRGGECAKSQWVKDDGFWYYLGADGAMLTGLQTIDGKQYFLSPTNYAQLPFGACVITDGNGVLK